jgi:hypothetical protein
MYDLYTCAVVFFLLCPGVVIPTLPSGIVLSALLHAIVFYVVLYYVSNYVAWWFVWTIAALVLMGRLFLGSGSG